MKIVNVFKHFNKVCTHKRCVAKHCFKAKLYWRGITHDLSKFSPIEFWESVKYYNGIKSPIDICKEQNGYSKAWLHHKGRNRHHYEYWVDNFDKGGEPLKMPYKDVLELVCDYLGAGQAYFGKRFSYSIEYGWWLTKIKNPLAMHPHTKEFINIMLFTMAKENSNDILRPERSKRIYDGLKDLI